MTRLDVRYQDDGEPELVGGLLLDARGVVHFQYAEAWLASQRELSPLRLPLSLARTVVPAPDRGRSLGLHGLFADSLPDAWGMKIIDLALRRRGLDVQRVTPLDRLAFLGDRTMGALTYRPSTESIEPAAPIGSLDALAARVDRIHEGDARPWLGDGGDGGAGGAGGTRGAGADATRALDALERAAGSPGGAQPKVMIAVSIDGATIVAGGESPRNYIPLLLKFSPRHDGLGLRRDQGQVEHAYALMARDAGIEMPPSRLFATADGRRHFAVERFDRTRTGGRRHVHSLGGMLEREASDAGDYDELLRLTWSLTADRRQVDEVLRRLCFNLVMLNDDDHLKNVAFLLDPARGWLLAPTYDLTFSPSRAGERGMSVSGFEADVTWRTVEALAARHGMREARFRELRAEVAASVAKWARFAGEAEVPGESVREIGKAIKARGKRLAS